MLNSISYFFFLSAYSDFFGIEPSYVDQNKQYTRPDASSFYIHENSYLNIQGGAISFAPYTASDILLESCIFGNCTSIVNGGCLYLYNVKNVILHRICCYNCYTGGSGNLGYIYSINRDEIHFVSASGTSPVTMGTGVFYLYYYNHVLKNNNISQCKASCSAFIYCDRVKTLNAIMNNICDCTCSDSQMYYIGAYPDTSYFNHSNFINNSGTIYGLFYFYYYAFNFIFYESIFQNNKGNLFATDGNPTVTVNNCWIVHNVLQYSITKGLKITLNSGISYTSTHVISLHSTYECQTIENPLGFEVTPHRTFPNPPTECFVVESNIGGTHLLMTVLAIKLTILELLFT